MESVWVFPVAAGAVIFLALIGWIFQAEPVNHEQQVDSVRAMFPDIPVAIIRQEMARSGSVQVAIERLLEISQNFPASVPQQQQQPHPQYKSILSRLSEGRRVEPERVDPEQWKRDPNLRQDVFNERKRQMLLKARQSYQNRT